MKNVEEDDRAYDELIALGFRVVPVTMIGDRLIKGYDAAALSAALADLRAGGARWRPIVIRSASSA